MKYWASIIALGLGIQVAAISLNKEEPVCLSRFDHDYKVIQKLVMLEQQQTELRETISNQQQQHTELRKTISNQQQQGTELRETITKQQQQQTELRETITKQLGVISEMERNYKGQGSTYVRWGRTTCDGHGTEMVYSGFTAGSPYELKGGAASYICLPEHPTWAQYVDGIQGVGGYMSGTEYELSGSHTSLIGSTMANQDAPCAVCRSPRPTTLMIPGHIGCYTGWTLEYTGYLMTGHTSHTGGTDYACVDAKPEAVSNGDGNKNGNLLYLTEVKCGSLPCQEYPDGRELACAVCSK